MFGNRDRDQDMRDNSKQSSAPRLVVDAFIRWLRYHDLIRDWTVDDIWYLAVEDFAIACEVALPPRRVFLGELKKHADVIACPNKRIYSRKGQLLRKTTIYSIAKTPVTEDHKVAQIAA